MMMPPSDLFWERHHTGQSNWVKVISPLGTVADKK